MLPAPISSVAWAPIRLMTVAEIGAMAPNTSAPGAIQIPVLIASTSESPPPVACERVPVPPQAGSATSWPPVLTDTCTRPTCAAAPCTCHSPGAATTTSPGPISSRSPPASTNPAPAVTIST